MSQTVQRVARQVHDDRSYLEYAAALDALLAEHGAVVEPRFVPVPVQRADGERAVLPTFVMESGCGTPVVFLNGTPATASVWAPLLGALTGVRAIVVDRPGHGLSGAFDYAGLPDLRRHAVAFQESLLDVLGLDQAVMAGNSLGGLWALLLAVDCPQRVSGVVLPGLPPGLGSDRTPLIFGLLSVPWVGRLLRRLDPPRPAATRRMFAMMGDPPAALSHGFVDVFTRGQRLPNVEGGTVHLIQHLRFPGRLPRSMWLDGEALAGLRRPTLFLAGRRDFLGGHDAARRMAESIPGAEWADAGVGHLPWLQDPASVAVAIRRFAGSLAGMRP